MSPAVGRTSTGLSASSFISSPWSEALHGQITSSGGGRGGDWRAGRGGAWSGFAEGLRLCDTGVHVCWDAASDAYLRAEELIRLMLRDAN